MIAPDMIADAVQRKLADIDRHAAMLQDQHLSHGGSMYHADPGSLATITTTLAIVQMQADTDPVPTPPPVTGAWLTALSPLITKPSAAIRSSGLTITTSPTTSSSTPISAVFPSSLRTSAVRGASSASASMARLARPSA